MKSTTLWTSFGHRFDAIRLIFDKFYAYKIRLKQICRRCQLHRWQIMGTISDCLLVHRKVNLRKKIYLYVNSTTQRCPNKIFKTFLIEDFFHLPPVSTTPAMHLEQQISPWIFTRIRKSPNGILGGLGKLIHEKKLKSKISWHCPFKAFSSFLRNIYCM